LLVGDADQHRLGALDLLRLGLVLVLALRLGLLLGGLGRRGLRVGQRRRRREERERQKDRKKEEKPPRKRDHESLFSAPRRADLSVSGQRSDTRPDLGASGAVSKQSSR